MHDYKSIVDRLRGPLAPITPAFGDDEALDLESTCRWIDHLVNGGAGMFWLTPGTSRYMCLSDEEIFEMTSAVAAVTRWRAILIAATSAHWPVHLSRRYIEHSAQAGADIVKVCPDPSMGGHAERTLEIFEAVAVDSPLPLFGYTLTPPGGSPLLPPAMLPRLFKTPAYVGMKNDSGDFYEHRDYLWQVRQADAAFVPMTGGSMMSFLFGYEFGARAFCSAVSMVAPQVPLTFYEHLIAGRRQEAVGIVKDHEEPFIAEMGDIGGWQAIRAALHRLGLFGSRRDRRPWPTLDDAQTDRLMEHLTRQGWV